jgi:hypothetical protein
MLMKQTHFRDLWAQKHVGHPSSISNEQFGLLLVCVITCRDDTLCQMAASLLNSGRASMRVATEWLKQGLPFCPEFAITHITECASRGPGMVSAQQPFQVTLSLQVSRATISTPP